MNFQFSPSRRVLVGLGIALVLLTGCRSARPSVSASIGITSPPPPAIGSSPIAAYDEYAWGVAPAEKVHVESLAQLGSR
jgi:hypothetical protein